ncbi:MAG: hypothetical protein ACE5K1_02870 [Acidiferrobacterales bacterium]
MRRNRRDPLHLCPRVHRGHPSKSLSHANVMPGDLPDRSLARYHPLLQTAALDEGSHG